MTLTQKMIWIVVYFCKNSIRNLMKIAQNFFKNSLQENISI